MKPETLNDNNILLLTVQGWSSIIPTFDHIDFISLYIEIPVMIVMFIGWWIIRRPDPNPLGKPASANPSPENLSHRKWWRSDLVDVKTIDLQVDEYDEPEEGQVISERRASRTKGRLGWIWRVYYWVV